MCKNTKPFLHCQNKQQIVVQQIFHSFTRVCSMTRNDCILVWRHDRRGGISFPACRGNTWLCAGGSTAVVWPPAFHYRDYARLNHHPNLCWKHPPAPKAYGFIINIADTLPGEALTKWFIIYSSLQIAYSSCRGYRETHGNSHRRETIHDAIIIIIIMWAQFRNLWEINITSLTNSRGNLCSTPGGFSPHLAPGRPSCRIFQHL